MTRILRWRKLESAYLQLGRCKLSPRFYLSKENQVLIQSWCYSIFYPSFQTGLRDFLYLAANHFFAHEVYILELAIKRK